MADLQRQVLEKHLHPHAQQVAESFVTDFAEALVLQSKTLATLDRSDEVQSVHVEAARELILATAKNKDRSQNLWILIGSILLGAFLQGFLTEFANGRPALMAVYALAGFIGMLLVFRGFRK